MNRTGLAYYRERKGLTQAALAKIIGTTQGRMSRIEGQIEIPTEQEVDQLVEAMGVPPSYLFDARILGIVAERAFQRSQAAPTKAVS